MKKYLLICISLLFVMSISLSVLAENIHFNDEIYKLKMPEKILKSNIEENEYYKDNENSNQWTSKIKILYYPDVNNPLKYSNETDKKIESDNKCVLLKFIQNKKNDIALISYLENVSQNNQSFFVYNIVKFEKHPKKGMMELQFSAKYLVNSKQDILKMVDELKNINNDYMERLIISPIPPIVSK